MREKGGHAKPAVPDYVFTETFACIAMQKE
jgi:hypothetical protein